MTNLQQTLLEKARGGVKFDPDQQRKFLETFEERVLVTVNLEEAEANSIQKGFKDILNQLQKEYSPLFVKLSPNLSENAQLFYLKIASQAGLTATIVSNDCQNSPFGLIIHTDRPVDVANKDVFARYPELLSTSPQTKPQKQSFWKKLFS